MKRGLYLLLAALAISIGGVCAAAAGIMEQSDQVVFTQETLYGDPSVAEGLEATVRTHMGRRLFWDSRCVPGAQPETVTQYESFCKRPGAELEGGRELKIGRSHHYGTDFENPENNTGMEIAMMELAQDTKPGESQERLVYVKDYYEHYPLRIVLSMDNLSGSSWEVHDGYRRWDDRWGWITNDEADQAKKEELAALADFFAIPPREDECEYIHLEKLENGLLSGMGGGPGDEDSFDFKMTAVDGGEGFYVAFDNRTRKGAQVDTSHIPGGYGIYYLPYLAEYDPEQTTGLLVEELKLVYPMEEGAWLRHLSLSPDGSKLILFTLEEGWHTLTVIDRATMEPLQRLPLLEEREGFEFWELYRMEKGLVLELYDTTLVVLAEDGEGLYTLDMEVPIRLEENDYNNWDGHRSYAYNGQYLARMEEGFEVVPDISDCGFLLTVYDKTGPIYSGQYTSSLSMGESKAEGVFASTALAQGWNEEGYALRWTN